jgi:phospholipid/cholesterol/gamma-HCH transport system ATP-binding protein
LSAESPVANADAPAVEFDHVSFAFDDQVVLEDVSFRVPRGSLRFLLGATGSGKSVLLKLVLGLFRPDSGTITVNGQRIDHLPERDLLRVRGDIGMLFQENALFDSLTVAENVGYRLSEESDMPAADVRQRVEEVLGFIGLGEFVSRMPSELSGGQRRRVGLARAMASRPPLLLLDDPTTGLDPITSITVDDQIVKLRDLEHVTAIVSTHQLRDAFYVATHVATGDGSGVERAADQAAAGTAEFMVLHNGRLHFEGPADELLASDDPVSEGVPVQDAAALVTRLPGTSAHGPGRHARRTRDNACRWRDNPPTLRSACGNPHA